MMDSLKYQEILEGLPLILPCLVTGTPSPNITWFKNDELIVENDKIQIMNDDKFLNIPESSSSDTGNFSCHAENEAGSISFDFNVKILIPPKLIENSVISTKPMDGYFNDKKLHNSMEQFDPDYQNPNLTIVLRGESIKLDCVVYGDPNPKIHWVKINYLDETKNEIVAENQQNLVRFLLNIL